MADEDMVYEAWLRKQQCALCGGPPPCTVHHPQGAGMGLRAHSHGGIAMHQDCHVQQLHGLTGRCKGWTKDYRRDWEATQARQLRARFEGAF